jgi:carboxylesterase type B
LNAANSVPGILSYNSVALSYLPRPDGKALTVSPDLLIKAGKYAKVPFIIGDQEDEGTLFALFQANITTNNDLGKYLNTVFFPTTPRAVIDGLINTYQTITEDGSPFRTLLLNNFYPQFKRLAAILGDITFTLTRRVFLETSTLVNADVPSWSYLSSYDYGTAILGTFHGSDLLQVFYGTLPNNAAKSIRGYYYNFVYDLDPNKGVSLPKWPRWSESKQLVQFGAFANTLLADSFRADSYAYLKGNITSFYI